MSKTTTLPWFKLPSTLITQPKFQRLSCDAQAGFITLCCVYWQDGGNMTVADAEYNSDSIRELIERGYVHCDDGMISIDFLDEQLDEYDQIIEKRREAGRKGGKAKGKQTEASAKQVLSKPKQVLNTSEASAKQTEADEMRLDDRDEIRLNEKEEIREGDKRANAPAPENDAELIEAEEYDPSNDQSQDEEKEKVAPKRKRFVPPTEIEAQAFFQTTESPDSWQQFFDYYTSNGWRVGKNPMKDWKAAARKWVRTENQYQTQKPNNTKKNEKPFADLTPERFFDSIDRHLEKKRQNRANGHR